MEEFKKAVANAETAVEDLPKHLQPVAFDRALTWLLRGNSETVRTPNGSSAGGDTGRAEETATRTVAVDLPPVHVVAESTNREKLAWAVVMLHSRGEEATVASVRQLIKDELSVTPPDRSHASSGLRALTPRYLKREKSGRGYAYQPKNEVAGIFKENGE